MNVETYRPYGHSKTTNGVAISFNRRDRFLEVHCKHFKDKQPKKRLPILLQYKDEK